MKRTEQVVDLSNEDLQYIWSASQTVLMLDALGLYHSFEFRSELMDGCRHNCKTVETAAEWTRQQSFPVGTQSPKGLYILNGAAQMAVMASVELAQKGYLDSG